MKDPKNVRKNLLTVLAVLCALALGIAVGALLLPKDEHLPPDRAPEQDPNAVPYEEDTTIPGGEGGSVTLRYQATAEIDRESGTVSLAFVDPASSDQGLVIQLLIQGEVLAERGLLPPGDIRSCILALANTDKTMRELLNYRFTEGSLAGQSFGNLFLAAMNGISGSFDEAVHRMGDVLAITGRVLPVTNQDVHLEAEFEDGSRCLGESKIYYAKKENDCRIRQVRLVPEHPQALPDSLEAIARADLIILGPGSLYTSIIPNFLVDGIADAIRRSRAVKALVLNVMTQDGETEGYTASDHVKAILHHAGPNVVDVCVANSRPVPEESLAPYLAEGAEPLRLDREEIMALGVAVREFPLCSSGRYIRHNPDELAKAVLDVWKEFRIH